MGTNHTRRDETGTEAEAEAEGTAEETISAGEVRVGDVIDTLRGGIRDSTPIIGRVTAIKAGPGRAKRRLTIDGVDYAFLNGAPVKLIERE